MTECKSMLDAFKAGGDFHSRTAMQMYPHIQQAIQRGEVVIDDSEASVPGIKLVKDVFKTERKHAKVRDIMILLLEIGLVL
jgi:DNA polymerase-1